MVAIVQAGTIGKIRAVHGWSGKHWGDRNPRPDRSDKVPANLNWNFWLGVAADRPFLRGYYHPASGARLDFGTGTFGDMGCHILDPVFTALAPDGADGGPLEGARRPKDSWGLDSQVRYTFPGTKFAVDRVTLTWYDGDLRPPENVRALIGKRRLSDQGSIYIGTEGVLYSPYIASRCCCRRRSSGGTSCRGPGENHYLQFVEACRGNGRTSTPFDIPGR